MKPVFFFSLVSIGERKGEERKGNRQEIHCPKIIKGCFEVGVQIAPHVMSLPFKF